MEFLNVKRIYEKNKKAIDKNVNDVLSSGQYIGGKYVEKLEDELSDYTNSICVTCGNGTDALHLALKVTGLDRSKRIKRIAVPAFGFPAAIEMILLLGGSPVYVDVGDDFNINPDLIPDDVDGVIAMSLFGVSCQYKKIRCKIGWNKKFIIDAAQSFSGYIGNQLYFADVVTTSFHPSKILGCFGDGGAIFTKSPIHRDVARIYRNHGRSYHTNEYIMQGINSRLDNIQAAILLARLNNLSYELSMRKTIAYNYGISKDSLDNSLYSCFPIITANRDSIRKRIEERGVPTKCYYDKALSPLPMARTVAEKIFQIPIDPYMTKEEINIVKEGGFW